MKYITNIQVKYMAKLPEEDTRERCPDAVKKHVLEYFGRFGASLFTSAPAIDIFTGAQICDANNGYSDGEYTWYEDEIYHFEHYGLKLCPDFIEHIMRQIE